MNDQFQALLNKLKNNTATFKEVINFIESVSPHTPTAFKNGDVFNDTTQNQGSAKVFAFAQKQNMSADDTLYLFAEHYQAVRANPDATDHQNIRQFMVHGWKGIVFSS